MKLRKIKDLRKKGNTQERTEKQLEANKNPKRILMLTKNPMKNPDIAKKNANKRKGKITSPKTLFKKGNQFGKKNKGNINQINAGRITGIKNAGKKYSDKQKQKAKEIFIKNNPMKNPEIVKKQKESRKRDRKILTNQKRRKASLNNENIKRAQFFPKILITDTLKERIVLMYKNNWSLQRIADEICLHSKTIKKILILKGIQIRSSNLAFQLSHKNKKHLLEIATNGRKEGIGLKYDNRNKMEVIK